MAQNGHLRYAITTLGWNLLDHQIWLKSYKTHTFIWSYFEIKVVKMFKITWGSPKFSWFNCHQRYVNQQNSICSWCLCIDCWVFNLKPCLVCLFATRVESERFYLFDFSIHIIIWNYTHFTLRWFWLDCIGAGMLLPHSLSRTVDSSDGPSLISR